MGFHDIYFPKFMEPFLIGKSEFSTSVVTGISGREIRSPDRSSAKQKYSVEGCRLGRDCFDEFTSFFRARHGRAFSFRLRDPSDRSAKMSFIGTGDGLKREFGLVKTYKDSVSPYVRRITRPAGEVKIYSGESAVKAKIDYNGGYVLFPVPPGKNESIFADFDFDVPVRFLSDVFSYGYGEDGSVSIENLEMTEVFE